MKLSELFANVNEIKLDETAKNLEITGITSDSRAVRDGYVFVCIRGYQTDGHKYIDSAIKNGAVFIVMEDSSYSPAIASAVVGDTRKVLASASSAFFGNPSKKFKIIGVTGTNGKTTVTNLIKTMLENDGKKVGLIGTNCNMIGDRVLPTERTTPDSYELNKLFNEMAEEKIDCCVMEVSSHSLELSRVHGIEFETAVFTNLTQDHLDFHVTMENYFNAKKKLFDVSKSAVINADDSYGIRLVENPVTKTVTLGANGDNTFNATGIKFLSTKVMFTIQYDNKEYEAIINIPGMFSLYNALCAIAACVMCGMPIEKAIEGLALSHGVCGRCEVHNFDDFAVIIDYAHTPDGLENILNTVNGFKTGRLVALFGCGGDRDRTKRPIMGEIAGNKADFCIITSDNPRTEDPMSIIREIEEGTKKTGCPYTVIENRYEAIKYALTNAQKDDIIVLCGKGHETYQILGDKTIHFDEREVIEEIMKDVSGS